MKKTYQHPLDYALGLKHYLTDEYINIPYTPSPESFYVEEMLDLDKSSFRDKLDGEYLVYRVWKKGVDTWYAVEYFSKIVGIPSSNIVFLGLKDKESTSIQHFFVKKNLLRKIDSIYRSSNIEFRLIGSIDRKPTRNLLVGNRFKIIVSNVSWNDYQVAEKIMERIRSVGLPSYYGYQRFGIRRPNTHILGKYLLTRRLDLFIDELLYRLYPGEEPVVLAKRYARVFDTLYYEKKAIKYIATKRILSSKTYSSLLKGLLIDAYQSYLYNILLSRLLDENEWRILYREYPVPACRGSEKYYYEILDKEGVDHESLLSTRRCWMRRGVFNPYGVEVHYSGNKLIIEFSLERGMYASIVLRELFKKKLML